MQSTMLIVDDVEMNRAILKMMFSKEYDVIEAENGNTALEILQACAGNIDIMLLDLIMPEMDGITFLKEHRKDPYIIDIPIVVITTSDHLQDQISAFECGANDYIAKPFMPEIVISRVRNVMNSSRRLFEIEREKEKLKVQSETDQMTALYNKMTTETMISDALGLYPRAVHAMMIVDIDNFKSVNDVEGHLVGDQTIKIIANQIVSLFRKSDIIGRVGGDEFCIFMGKIPNREIARKKAEELALLLKYKPNLTLPANVSVSVGLAFSDGEYMDYRSLFEKADQALYEAKKAGKARVAEYGQEIQKEEELDQDAVLLLSRNRNVCSIIHAVYGFGITVLECNAIESLGNVAEVLKKHIVMSFIDISGETDNGEALIQTIRSEHSWLDQYPMVAICKEGNLNQLKIAIDYQVTEVLTAPLEIGAVKRMSAKYVDSVGEKEPDIISPESFF